MEEIYNKLIYPQAHCDSRVLHTPGHCEYCDRFPKAQQRRIELNVAFTDELKPKGKFICPALAERSAESINGWGGNQPHGPGVTEEEISWFERIERFASRVFYGDTRERHNR